MKTMLTAICVLFLSTIAASVPIYGTTRYGRPPWAYRAAPAYYRQPYPFAQAYPEELYYQPDPIMHYPYYPISRPLAKNELYQTIYPYYYNDRLRPYGYYTNENAYVPNEEMSEGLHDDALRSNARTESLPVGQETWFEGETVPRWQNDYDDVNTAFLQNLIMSQMYMDAMAKNEQNDSEKAQEKPTDTDDYEERRLTDYYGDRDTRDFEDEDVRELKALAGKPLYHVPKTNNFALNSNDKTYNNQQWHKDYSMPSTVRRDDDHYSEDYPGDEAWINWGSKRGDKASKAQKLKSVLKSTIAPTVSTTPFSTTKAPTAAPKVSGQKEEVFLRPATPVRHPFPEPVMHMLVTNAAQKKRTPSVYDTIKQMLTMEDSLQPNFENKPRVQKRYVSTEEDLVGELKGLKRRTPA